jgi:hypothetical protein
MNTYDTTQPAGTRTRTLHAAVAWVVLLAVVVLSLVFLGPCASPRGSDSGGLGLLLGVGRESATGLLDPGMGIHDAKQDPSSVIVARRVFGTRSLKEAVGIGDGYLTLFPGENPRASLSFSVESPAPDSGRDDGGRSGVSPAWRVGVGENGGRVAGREPCAVLVILKYRKTGPGTWDDLAVFHDYRFTFRGL